jgi:hypothetical protein
VSSELGADHAFISLSTGIFCTHCILLFYSLNPKTHFEFISWHFHADGSGVKAAKLTHDLLKDRKQQVMRDMFLQQVKSRTLEIAGAAIAFLISYTVNVALQRRLRGGY